MPSFDDLRQDLRFATRTLTRERVFSTLAVLMLALGIGANSAMFALVDATLLRPLPFAAPDRLVMLWERTPTTPRARVSPINLIDWKARNNTFDPRACERGELGTAIWAPCPPIEEDHRIGALDIAGK